MSDEYEHKLEAKSDYVSDASSGTSAPDIENFLQQNYRIKNFIIHTAGGRHMYFHKTQST